MLIPIRCMTCGKVLADKWYYYKQRVYQDAANEESLAPGKGNEGGRAGRAGSGGGSGGGSEANDVKSLACRTMDKLGITNACCRRMILGHVDVHDNL
jgi:DNA-directed RNA polymerase subunit N (RpoN/RPB10)